MAFDGQGSDLPLFYGGYFNYEGTCAWHIYYANFWRKNTLLFQTLHFLWKKFPDIYDIQIELEQSKVGQNEMLR